MRDCNSLPVAKSWHLEILLVLLDRVAELRLLKALKQVDGTANHEQFELWINRGRNQDMTLLFGFISLFCTLLIFLVDDVGPDVTENFFP